MAITSCVHVWVKPACVKEFMEATFENQLHSSQEEGNIRFDVCQDTTNPCKFLLYEAYLDESFAIAHKETAHYLKWRDTVASFMEQPRKADKYHILAY